MSDTTEHSGDADSHALGVASPVARPPIRLGVIGTGLAARRLHWPALARMPERFTITAFCDAIRATAEEYAALTGLPIERYHAGYHDLLAREDVEAVVVAVPIPQLYPIACDCLAAGKHLICEKPPGASEAEALEFAALVDRYPRQKILMAEDFFYRNELRLARSLVDGGAIGLLRLLREHVAKHEVPAPGSFASTPWRSRPRYPGGSLLDGGVHDIATLRLLGGDVTSLFARTEWLNDTIDAPSTLTMIMEFATGATGTLFYGSFGVPFEGEVNDTRLYGTEGNLIASRGQVTHVHPDGAVEEYRFAGSDGYYNEFLNFYEAIVYDEPIVGTVAQSVKNMLTVLRALDSAAQGRPGELGAAGWNAPLTGVPLWRPRGARGLFDRLPVQVTHTRREGERAQ
jgi:predicted dehydrogenase